MSRRELWLYCSCLCLVLTAAILLSYFKIAAPDIFWHLKTGQVILETGRLLKTNTFSSTYPNHSWLNYEWLFQVGAALAHRWGGWTGLAAAKIMLVAALAAALYALLVAAAGKPFTAASITVLALAVMRFRFTERPHLVSLLFFACFMIIADRHLRRGDRLVWILPPLAALWSNIHPEVIIGLVYLFGLLAGLWLNRLTGRNGIAKTRSLQAASLLCLPAILANPEGYWGIIYPFLHTEISSIVVVSEFNRSTLSAAPLFWLYAALASLLMLLGLRRWDWRHFILLGGFGVMGALHLRAVPYFALAAAPFITRRLEDLSNNLGRHGAKIIGAAAVSAALAASFWTQKYDRLLTYHWGYGVDEAYFPVAATDFLASKDLPAELFNDYTEGGYLIFRLYPRFRVFQDGRYPAYPQEFFKRLHAGNLKTDWRSLFLEYGANTALVPTREVRFFFPRQDWGVVYWDDLYAVLVRRSPVYQPILDRFEYRYFLPEDDSWQHVNTRYYSTLAGEMERNLSERGRTDWISARNIGIMLGRIRFYDKAEKALRRAAGLKPGDSETWAYLGMALEMTGKNNEARDAYQRAISLNPRQEKALRFLNALEPPPP